MRGGCKRVQGILLVTPNPIPTSVVVITPSSSSHHSSLIRGRNFPWTFGRTMQFHAKADKIDPSMFDNSDFGERKNA